MDWYKRFLAVIRRISRLVRRVGKSDVRGDVPVVDGTVGVAGGEHLDVSCGGVGSVDLAIVDVVLMQRLLGHHHRIGVQLHAVEEDCASSEGICADSGRLCLAEAGVERALESPVVAGPPLENERNVVETAANVCVFANEAASQDRIAVVDYSLGLGLGLAGDTVGGEGSEVHLAVV